GHGRRRGGRGVTGGAAPAARYRLRHHPGLPVHQAAAGPGAARLAGRTRRLAALEGARLNEHLAPADPPIAAEIRVDPRRRTHDDRVVNVEAINIGPSDSIAPVEMVTARAGKGLEGDRHYFEDGAKPG